MSKKDDTNDQHHSGSIAAEDEELTLWLNRLWARNEPPERLEVWQALGRNKSDRGEMIHHVDFKHGVKLDIEQANKLANEIIAIAQNDCDSVQKKSWFLIAILDHNRRAVPLVRRLGPLQPKRSYAVAKTDEVHEDDEEYLDAKNLELTHIKMGFEEVRYDKRRNDHVLGEVLLLLSTELKEQRVWTSNLMNQLMDSFTKQQEAQDRSLDREVIREREKLKISLWKDGVRTARNLLPGLFAKDSGEEVVHAPTNGTNGTNGTTKKNYGPSPERALVDNLLNDFEEAKIDIALFGDWDEKSGKCITPGVFTIKQLYILEGVRNGRLPPSALDDLMPNSGHENAITQEQVEKASEAGVTEGMAMALMEIIGLRNRAKQAANSTANEKEIE